MEGVLTVVDFEGSRGTGVFETGMVRLEGGRITETFTTLHCPRDTPTVAERVLCGVDARQLENRPPFNALYERFVDARRRGLFCAHNATTEHHLLLDTFPFPPAGPAPEGGVLSGWGPWVDSLVLARRFAPELGEHGLGAVISGLGLDQRLQEVAATYCPPGRCRPHAALYDALASALLIQEFARRGWIRSARDALAGGSREDVRPVQGDLFPESAPKPADF